jgi:hypothetical protein
MKEDIVKSCEKIITDFSYWIESVYEELSDEFWAEIYDNDGEYILDSIEEDFDWFIKLMDKTPEKTARILEKIKELKK